MTRKDYFYNVVKFDTHSQNPYSLYDFELQLISAADIIV